MIHINHLTFTYPGADKPTLKDITLHIEKGDFLAVIGNNGCGKSTMCKTLNGLIPHFITGDFEGTVMIDGLDTQEHNVGSLARKAGYVYQDFENQIVRPTVLDDASFACLNYAMADYEQRGIEALTMCGLALKEKDYVWQLSGGQKHLLALAGMTVLSPEVLILDEPIAQLDPAHAKQIYNTLRILNEKYNKTIIVIEHHTEYIMEFCKNAVLMRDGQVVWKLPVSEALRRVDELEACNIYPPQITIAAYKLQKSWLFGEAGRAGLDAVCLTEHFNTQGFNEIYEYIDKSYRREGDCYIADSLRIFPGMEIDIAEGGHILVIGTMKDILSLNHILDAYKEKNHFLSFELLVLVLRDYPVLLGAGHPFREGGHIFELPFEQLRQFDFIDLNGKDIAANQDITENQVYSMAKQLDIPVVAGSDTHQSFQYGCIKNDFKRECHTIFELKTEMQKGNYNIDIAKTAALQVKTAGILKRSLKEIHALGGDYVSVLVGEDL